MTSTAPPGRNRHNQSDETIPLARLIGNAHAQHRGSKENGRAVLSIQSAAVDKTSAVTIPN